MLVYSYDKNGYYNGTTVAQPDPLMGGFLRPAHTTAVAPPQAANGQIAQWTQASSKSDDGSWALVVDPAVVAQQAQARLQHLVVFYRNTPGKDTAVLSWGRFGALSPDGQSLNYLGKPLSDPSNAGVASQEFGTDPGEFDAKNANGVSTQKIVGGQIEPRDPNDIFLDDVTAQSKRSVIFYRNRNGYDTRILSVVPWSQGVVNSVVQYGGKPITDPSNSNVAYFMSDTLTANQVIAVNSNGVMTNKVDPTSNSIVPRAAADIAKDRDNISSLNQSCDQQIAQLLSSSTNTPLDTQPQTHLMIVQHALDVKLHPELYTAQDAANADATLSIYRPLYAQIQQLRAQRDASIAGLEAV